MCLEGVWSSAVNRVLSPPPSSRRSGGPARPGGRRAALPIQVTPGGKTGQLGWWRGDGPLLIPVALALVRRTPRTAEREEKKQEAEEHIPLRWWPSPESIIRTKEQAL